MRRYYYSNSIALFQESSINEIIGELSINSNFKDEQTQKDAWKKQIEILKITLLGINGHLYFEYSIPRMGRRIDVVLLIDNVLFVVEFKVGETEYHKYAIDQVWDYALDLKNFHETSHSILIAPILVSTNAKENGFVVSTTHHDDNLLFPIATNATNLSNTLTTILNFAEGEKLDASNWSKGNYSPTPTIIEAAMSLYNNHSVKEITRNDAEENNLSTTSKSVSEIIQHSKEKCIKSICFVTGVPGAGKTLVGLDVATNNINSERHTSVFLSGNGPLVAILREALTRDKVRREKLKGIKINKSEVFRSVKSFIQNVHHFRDDCLSNNDNPPFDHVAIFDEAQRAWNLHQTSSFMKRKKNKDNFNQSEPEFLISCMDRHSDWAVIVCLVGGGQEINTGEAGIVEWVDSINRSFQHWNVYISPQLKNDEFSDYNPTNSLDRKVNLFLKEDLHLSVSMRSFRAENLSLLIKNLLDLSFVGASNNYKILKENYPIVITRDINNAKLWLRKMARGTERYGIVVSSQAYRLRPQAIDVRASIDPVHWFLGEKEDVRSSYFLEDVATEFQVQGLELDWACITWDADFRYNKNGWETYSFVGTKWNRIIKAERKQYLKNAYRVLLTRARQGMVIVVPNGDDADSTRMKEYYDSTYNYLASIGFEVI